MGVEFVIKAGIVNIGIRNERTNQWTPLKMEATADEGYLSVCFFLWPRPSTTRRSRDFGISFQISQIRGDLHETSRFCNLRLIAAKNRSKKMSGYNLLSCLYTKWS